jgi:hypothetical protein
LFTQYVSEVFQDKSGDIVMGEFMTGTVQTISVMRSVGARDEDDRTMQATFRACMPEQGSETTPISHNLQRRRCALHNETRSHDLAFRGVDRVSAFVAGRITGSIYQVVRGREAPRTTTFDTRTAPARSTRTATKAPHPDVGKVLCVDHKRRHVCAHVVVAHADCVDRTVSPPVMQKK